MTARQVECNEDDNSNCLFDFIVTDSHAGFAFHDVLLVIVTYVTLWPSLEKSVSEGKIDAASGPTTGAYSTLKASIAILEPLYVELSKTEEHTFLLLPLLLLARSLQPWELEVIQARSF
jgi:hypothetical protein